MHHMLIDIDYAAIDVRETSIDSIFHAFTTPLRDTTLTRLRHLRTWLHAYLPLYLTECMFRFLHLLLTAYSIHPRNIIHSNNVCNTPISPSSSISSLAMLSSFRCHFIFFVLCVLLLSLGCDARGKSAAKQETMKQSICPPGNYTSYSSLPIEQFWYGANIPQCTFVDINGDGRIDYACSATNGQLSMNCVYLNSGRGFLLAP